MMEFRTHYNHQEPHLATVLEFILAHPELVHIVVVRTLTTAKTLAKLFPDHKPEIVRGVKLDKALLSLANKDTRLVIGSREALCHGWRPPWPEITAVSSTYDLSPSYATQLSGRLGSAYSPERALVWKRRNRRGDGWFIRNIPNLSAMYSRLRLRFERFNR